MAPSAATGRVSEEALPPLSPELPYRSIKYVRPARSHHGLGYKPGDPIPLSEALRQGVFSQDPPRLRACSRCHGTGKMGRPRGKHKPDCTCPPCQPCKVCGGSGEVRAQNEV